MPELLLQVRTKDLLERGAARLVALYEASEGLIKGDLIMDPAVKGVKPTEAQSMLDLVRSSIRQLTGREFTANDAQPGMTIRISIPLGPAGDSLALPGTFVGEEDPRERRVFPTTRGIQER